MATLEQFAGRMAAKAEKVPDLVSIIKRSAAIAIDRNVVLATPVDTGRARSNWIVSVGSPNDIEREPYSEGSKLGLGERANAQGAMDQAARAVSGKIALGVPVWIQNNVHYIGKLNNGHSPQALPGFVQNAALNGAAEIRRAKFKL